MQFASFLAFVLTVWLTSRFCQPSSRLYILDHPNERSLHTRPTPRTGGVAILFGILLGGAVVIGPHPEYWRLAWVFVGALLIGAVSFIDDHRGVRPLARLFVHVLGGGLVLASGIAPDVLAIPGAVWDWPRLAALLVSLVFIVWMVNLYNFMDGMDGLAGGMAVIGFGAFAAFGWLAGHLVYFTANLLVVGAAAGFLLFNFPPARIFMGDVGSAVLGLLAAAFSLWGVKAHFLPLWAALLVFSPFIIDATVTLIRRLLQGKKVWQAHKTHYYQRLVQLGLGHKKTVVGEYLVMIACALSALLAARQPPVVQYLVLGGWALFYLGTALMVQRWETRKDGLQTE